MTRNAAEAVGAGIGMLAAGVVGKNGFSDLAIVSSTIVSLPKR